MKAREVVTRLEKEGWYEARHTGGHKHFKHPEKPDGFVTVPVHSGDIDKDDLRSIYKQAGWGKLP